MTSHCLTTTRASTHRMRFAVLGSSSSGNASVLRIEPRDASLGAPRQILIDTGLSPKATRGRLSALGFDIADTTDILYTHFDMDHARASWATPVMCFGMTVRCARKHLPLAKERGLPSQFTHAFEGAFTLGSGITVTPIDLPHDAAGAVAFHIQTPAGSIGFATDLGRVEPTLRDAFEGVDLLAIESNYDHAMQVASSRPTFLKDRIMGGNGHLSNQQTLDFVRDLARTKAPERIVLLHLSRECNDPHVIQSLWQTHAPELWSRVTIARADEGVHVVHGNS
ncbi:MAG: MBL fold metallo-hydrolase [Phycisphaerales bacterium]|nr:MBL fold metallo-hydrolase [Phycisphaerales bacterium]